MDVDTIPFAPTNPKKHDVGGIEASVERYGMVETPTLNETTGKLVAGHGRIKALRELRRRGAAVPKNVRVEKDGKWYAPVLRGNAFANDTEASAYLVDANALTLAGSELDALQMAAIWEQDGYAELLKGLEREGALPVAVSAEDYGALLAEWGTATGTTNEDDDEGEKLDRAEEIQVKWRVQIGDEWEVVSKDGLQTHRLFCIDSEKEFVGRIGEMRAELVLTDPPYGINVVGGTAATVGGSGPIQIGQIRARRKYPFGGKKNMKVVGTVGGSGWVDATPYKPVHGDDKPFDPVWLLELSKEQILFGGNYFASKLKDSRCWLVWDKNNTGNFADCELAWTSFEKGVRMYRHTWNGLVRQGTRDVEGVRRVHPTQKPATMLAEMLRDWSDEGDLIFDPYLGSGSTAVACAMTRRVCWGAEIEPSYIAVTLERLSGLGLTPRRVVDGASTMASESDDSAQRGRKKK